jgi:hypothetical protein
MVWRVSSNARGAAIQPHPCIRRIAGPYPSRGTRGVLAREGSHPRGRLGGALAREDPTRAVASRVPSHGRIPPTRSQGSVPAVGRVRDRGRHGRPRDETDARSRWDGATDARQGMQGAGRHGRGCHPRGGWKRWASTTPAMQGARGSDGARSPLRSGRSPGTPASIAPPMRGARAHGHREGLYSHCALPDHEPIHGRTTAGGALCSCPRRSCSGRRPARFGWTRSLGRRRPVRGPLHHVEASKSSPAVWHGPGLHRAQDRPGLLPLARGCTCGRSGGSRGPRTTYQARADRTSRLDGTCRIRSRAAGDTAGVEEGLAMTSPRLRAYLSLERAMLDLDERADPLADRLRDAMDPLWYGLTDREHAVLDARRPEGVALLASPGTRAEVLQSSSPGLARALALPFEARTTSGSDWWQAA